MTSGVGAATKPPVSPGAFLLGVWCWLMACVLLPIVLLSNHTAPLPGLRLIVQLAVLLYAGTRLCMVLADARRRPIAGIFWLFTYVAMGVTPLAQLTTDSYPKGVQDFGTLLPATLIVLVGCCSFDIGHHLASRRPNGSVAPGVRLHRAVSRHRLLILSLFSIAATGYYITRVGGPLNFFSSREHLSESVHLAAGTDASTNSAVAILRAAGQVPVLLAFLCWTAKVFSRGRTGIADWCWWASLGSLNLVVNNPVSNSRFWFVTVVISILFVLPGLSPNRFRAILIAGAIAGLLVFPYSDIFRYEPGERYSTYSRPSPITALAGTDFDQMVMVANGIWWIESRGSHTDGRQLLGAVLFWVPRDLWAGKPTDTGVEIGTAMQWAETNLSSPLWIEAWVDFGWIGVVVALLAIGFFVRRTDDAYEVALARSGQSLTLVGLLVPVLAGYAFIILRGPLLQATAFIVAMIACGVFVTAGHRRQPLVDPLTRGRGVPQA